MSASTARCELAREQADSLREKVEERAHRGNHSAPRRENRVHDSHVSLQRRQQSDERAALQIVRNGEMWDKDCTNPLQRRAPQREEIVRAQARQVYQFGGLAIHSDEAPGRVLVGAPHRKRRHSSNILERLWFAVGGNEFGTGDKDHLVGPERAHGEIGILQWWLAYPYLSRPSSTTSTRRLVASSATRTRGCLARKRARTSATPPCNRPMGQEMRTSPCGEPRSWVIASFAACASSRSAKQWRWNVLPASVSERRRVVRLMRRTPSSVSSAAMRRLSFDVCKPSAFAAAV